MSASRERGGGLAPPPRTSRGRRGAAGALLACLAGALLLLAGLGRTQPPEDRADPARLEHPAADEPPDVLLYVSESCPWCAAEIEAWAALLSEAPEGSRGPRLVLAPGTPAGWEARLPRALAARAVLDADGALGRSLGIVAVPHRARLDSGAFVVGGSTGLSTAPERRALLAFLNPPTPGPSRSPR